MSENLNNVIASIYSSLNYFLYVRFLRKTRTICSVGILADESFQASPAQEMQPSNARRYQSKQAFTQQINGQSKQSKNKSVLRSNRFNSWMARPFLSRSQLRVCGSSGKGALIYFCWLLSSALCVCVYLKVIDK